MPANRTKADDGGGGTGRSLPIRIKVMAGLLGFSTLPVVLLGWFLSAQLDRAERASAMEIQAAAQKSAEEFRNLGLEAARYRAEEVAGAVAAFLRDHPDAQLRDLRGLRELSGAFETPSMVGCEVRVELLQNDRPVGLFRPAGDAAGAEGSGDVRPSQKKRYTYVARVPETDLKVVTTVRDLGIDRAADRLARSVQGIGERTVEEAGRRMGHLKLTLVIGVAVLVIGLTLVGGEIARTITRPVAKLTEAAKRIREGDRDVDLAVRGGRELQVLADAFQRTTRELQDYARSLEAKNVELDVARRMAEKATQELQEAQDDMLRMEKMSSLGRLVAGVAHEINTPTGAIYNTTAEAVESLERLTDGLHQLGAMSEEEFQTFRAMLDVAVARRLDPERVPRSVRRKIRQELEQQGIANAKKYAELLAKCHITELADCVRLTKLLEKYGVASVFTGMVEIHASMKISRTSAEKISQIVRALRFYSRGHGETELNPTDINQTIRDALIIAHNRLKHRVEVEADLAADLPPVRCSGGITEVWVNLLTNACDAIEEKGEKARGRIGVQSFSRDDQVVVVVSDDGRPVPPEVVSKMFDPFFTTKPPGKGTGLGLSVVMGTVQRNGGTVTLRAAGEKKEFEVTLPLERAADAVTV
jgi:signal transduction histidine kinase